MLPRLKHRLAIFVDEVLPKKFYWVLIEREDGSDQWLEIASADQPTATWVASFDLGNALLVRLIADLESGRPNVRIPRSSRVRDEQVEGDA